MRSGKNWRRLKGERGHYVWIFCGRFNFKEIYFLVRVTLTQDLERFTYDNHAASMPISHYMYYT